MARFTDSFLDELRDRTSIVEVIGSRLTWDARRSNTARGDFWACCPFHGEKTPSFHVVEATGRFYCFGCHEKGGAIDFLMKHDRLSFPEAVEDLARRAGLEIPVADPRAAAQSRQQRSLVDICERAAELFEENLAGPGGSDARDYLARRGVSPAAIERFGIGLSLSARDTLYRRLRGEGATQAQLIACDLVAEPKMGGSPYDRFRDRLMFPIRDARGRCVAFGGRDLTGKHDAKYMNSRETEIFQKRRTLFNLPGAREALARRDRPLQPLIVAEGYMDVVALWQGGFEAAVAPLGTAIGPDQLEALWKLSPCPVMALDGDAAGRRAAEKAAEKSLPLLGPDRSLRFALLPAGQDPDDFLRSAGGGVEALSALLDAATPLVEQVFETEAARGPLETPEAQAGLEARLAALVETIADAGVRKRYHYALRNRAFERFRALSASKRAARGGGRFERRAPGATAETKAAAGALLGPEAAEAVLLLILLRHPKLVVLMDEDLSTLKLSTPHLDTFLIALLSAVGSSPPETVEDPAALEALVDARIASGACAALRAAHTRRVPPSALRDVAVAEEAAREAARSLSARIALREEAEDYARAEEETESALCQNRLRLALWDAEKLRAPQVDGDGDDEGDLSRRLKAFVDDEPWIRRGKRAS